MIVVWADRSVSRNHLLYLINLHQIFLCFLFVGQTKELIARANNITVILPPSLYEEEFKRINMKLSEVQDLLTGPSVTMDDLNTLLDNIAQIR